MGEGTPRIDEIVARIRAELREAEARTAKPARPLGAARGLKQFPTLRDAEELSHLNRAWAIEPRTPISSHRPGIGPAVVAAKTRIQGLVVSVLEGYLGREREFLASLVRLLNRLTERIDALAAAGHADDELLVKRTEIFLKSMQEEQQGLLLEVQRLREEVSGLRRELGGAPMASPPRAAAPADFAPGETGEADESEAVRFGLYAAALAGEGPVVHLPAGRGGLLAALDEAGIEAFGVEPDQARAEGARSAGLRVRIGPLRLPEGVSPAAVVFTETEWMAPGLLERLLREARAALRPDGIVLVEARNPAAWASVAALVGADGRAHTWSPAGLAALLERCGFTEVRGDLAATGPAPLALPEVTLVSPLLRGVAENFERLNRILFAPAWHYAVGRRPEA